MKIKKYTRIAAGAALTLCLAVQVQASGSGMSNDEMMQELKRMIEQQQAQLDRQAAEIAALKEQLTGNSEALATKADKSELADTDKMVTSSFSNVNVSLYGHVNRAVLFADNGDTSRLYAVDNMNSQTRLGLKASVDTNSGWTVGGRIEYGIVSNGSSDVNQDNSYDATDENFKLRWAEISFKNGTYGTVSLGKGSSASDGSAEVDLSGTTVASYASVSDLAGGILWYDSSAATISGLRVKDVFSDMDGLSRIDRLRYDTPSFAGFSLAASAGSDDAYDGALRYSRAFGDTKVAAAFAVANPGDLNYPVDLQYSGSVSVLLPMGLNATFSAAMREMREDNREDPTNWWAKLGYKTKFYDAATTAFSIDYGQTNDLRADGDEGQTWGLAAVHDIIEWGTEFYIVYRNYQLDGDYYDVDDINTVMAGARLKF